jgi:hypothetical protein
MLSAFTWSHPTHGDVTELLCPTHELPARQAFGELGIEYTARPVAGASHAPTPKPRPYSAVGGARFALRVFDQPTGRLVAPVPASKHGRAGTYNEHGCRRKICTHAATAKTPQTAACIGRSNQNTAAMKRGQL